MAVALLVSAKYAELFQQTMNCQFMSACEWPPFAAVWFRAQIETIELNDHGYDPKWKLQGEFSSEQS